MKKIHFTVLILASVFSLTACTKAAPVNAPEVKGSSTHAAGNINSFDYGDDGSLYSIALRESGEYEIFPPLKPGDEEIKNPICEAVVNITDSSGETKQSYVFNQQTLGTTLEYKDGAVYFTALEYVDNTETAVLKKYILGESEPILLHCFAELDNIKKTALINDTIYILGTDSANIGKNETTDDFYINMGEKILAYNISENNVTVVMELGAVEMSETPLGTLMIYAHDNGGYFFTEYNQNGEFSDKQYSETTQLSSFTVCDNEKYVYSDVNTNAAVASFKDMGKADIPIDDLLSGNIKYCSDGRIGYIVSDYSEEDDTYSSILKDIDISEFLNSDLSKKITVISAEYIADAPSSLGYSVAQEQIDYDSFALTVLSQDPKYDIYLLYSRSNFAENIKSKGSFYPLNEVEGVKEYIDSCFPGSKEAAINDNGDIWMLPIAVSVPALVYSEELIDDAKELTAEKLITLINDMYNDKDKADNLGQFNAYFISELFLSNYLFGSTDLDTEEFRTIAETIKNDIFTSKAFSETSAGMLKAMTTGDYSDIDLMMAYHSDDSTLVTNSNQELRVTVFPMPTENPVPSTCAFICVNPMSQNLEQTLSYISVLAKSLTEDTKSLMRENSPQFAQNRYYEDLKEVYENASVRFSYSGEIVINDFYSYIEGKITLDQFIGEANRKLSVYLNE